MADLRIRYFAAAAEASGVEEESVSTTASTAGALKTELIERFGSPMARVFRSGSLLIDGVVSRDDNAALGATVDVLPPFSGG